MKTFYTFKEDLKKSLSPLKDFGKSFAGQAEKFAKSDDAKRLKFDRDFRDLIGLVPPNFFRTNNYIPEMYLDKAFQIKDEYSDKFGRSVTSICFQMAKKIEASKIYLAGYDGYSGNIEKKEAELQVENQQIFDDFGTLEIISITPSDYHIKEDSVYRLIR